jgi:hypothetical protein
MTEPTTSAAPSGTVGADVRTCQIVEGQDECGCVAVATCAIGDLCQGHRDLALIAGLKPTPIDGANKSVTVAAPAAGDA